MEVSEVSTPIHSTKVDNALGNSHAGQPYAVYSPEIFRSVPASSQNCAPCSDLHTVDRPGHIDGAESSS